MSWDVLSLRTFWLCTVYFKYGIVAVNSSCGWKENARFSQFQHEKQTFLIRTLFMSGRLRGLKYATWEDESKVFPAEGEEGGDAGLPPSNIGHKKFQNYRFDVDEFVKIMSNLEQEVRSDPRYQTAVKTGLSNKEEL